MKGRVDGTRRPFKRTGVRVLIGFTGFPRRRLKMPRGRLNSAAEFSSVVQTASRPDPDCRDQAAACKQRYAPPQSHATSAASPCVCSHCRHVSAMPSTIIGVPVSLVVSASLGTHSRVLFPRFQGTFSNPRTPPVVPCDTRCVGPPAAIHVCQGGETRLCPVESTEWIGTNVR